MPKKMRLNKLVMMTRASDSQERKEPSHLSAPDEGQDSKFRVLRAVLPPPEIT